MPAAFIFLNNLHHMDFRFFLKEIEICFNLLKNIEFTFAHILNFLFTISTSKLNNLFSSNFHRKQLFTLCKEKKACHVLNFQACKKTFDRSGSELCLRPWLNMYIYEGDGWGGFSSHANIYHWPGTGLVNRNGCTKEPC